MAYVSYGSIAPPLNITSGNHLWKKTGENWYHWDGSDWNEIGPTLQRLASADLTKAASVAVPSPEVGDVISHNSSAMNTFALGAGYDPLPTGLICAHTDDFVYVASGVWARTTNTPLTNTVGVIPDDDPTVPVVVQAQELVE